MAIAKSKELHDRLQSQQNKSSFDKSTRDKFTMADSVAKQMIDGSGHNLDDERERYFAYKLDNKAVGLIFITAKSDNLGELYIDYITSHPGVRGAATALLEAALEESGKEPNVTLFSVHGSLAVYRKLGFKPQNEEMFTSENLEEYDKMFLGLSYIGVDNLNRERKKVYDNYKQMRLQPHLSDLWELNGDSWHYKPDGDKYLADFMETDLSDE